MLQISEDEKVVDSELHTNSNSAVDQTDFNKKYTLLIVDDNAANRIVLKGMLSKLGYSVIVAEDGKQAVEMFRVEQPDMIFMDVMMPVMDGYEAAELIRSESNSSRTPILFVTALTDDHALVKCVEAGGDDFISKPYSPVILKAKVEVTLRNSDIYKKLQLKNSQLLLRDQEVAADLDIAERILSKITRDDAFDVKNINYYLSPMEQLNGDLIIVAHKPDGGQIYLLGDFTGHGLGAAIGGMVVFDVFKTMAIKGFSVNQIASEINRKLKEILPLGRFLAVGFVELNSEHSKALVWNGGLPDLYLCRNKSGEVVTIPSTNLPLGVVDSHEIEFVSETFQINMGDQFFLYSDGVIEAENHNDEFFGSRRLDKLIRSDNQRENLFKKILENVEDFAEGRSQTDDISLLEIICNPARVGDAQKIMRKAMLPATSWSMDFIVDSGLIKQADVVPSIVNMIVDIQGLNHCQKTIYLIMTELYTNALEHGLLDIDSKLKSDSDNGFDKYYKERDRALAGLDKGTITINVKHEPTGDGGKLTMRIAHDGDGFDVDTTQDLINDAEQNDRVYRRGIRLVKSLTERLDYEDFGKVVEVDYVWKED
ncbi:MAG: SpoIIE family protein phosphatase [Gammaproteobacteria bacterium]